jgi:hypothetical protein
MVKNYISAWCETGSKLRIGLYGMYYDADLLKAIKTSAIWIGYFLQVRYTRTPCYGSRKGFGSH